MTEPTRTRPARRPADARARERLREAQAAESSALAAVCAAEGKLAGAIARRDKAYATADAWVAAAAALVDEARIGLAAVSGVDRAAQLLGIGKAELRRSITSGRDGAA